MPSGRSGSRSLLEVSNMIRYMFSAEIGVIFQEPDRPHILFVGFFFYLAHVYITSGDLNHSKLKV